MKTINLDLDEHCNTVSLDHIIYNGKEYEYVPCCDECSLQSECCEKLTKVCSTFFRACFRLVKKPPIDNFDLLSKFLPENKIENEFYHVQILRRRKENPDIGSNSILVNEYYAKDRNRLYKLKEEIELLCKHYNARAYINLTPRDKEQLVLPMIRKLTSYLENKEFSTVHKTFSSVCSSNPKHGKKIWLIDIDDLGINIGKIVNDINNIKLDSVKEIIPTINGVHIITTPFNSDKFKNLYPNLDIKKNSLAFLYYGN